MATFPGQDLLTTVRRRTRHVDARGTSAHAARRRTRHVGARRRPARRTIDPPLPHPAAFRANDILPSKTD